MYSSRKRYNYKSLNYCMFSVDSWKADCQYQRKWHHTTPQPFYDPFLGPPGWAGAKRQPLVFMVQGKITEADTQTIQHCTTPSGLSSAHLHIPLFFMGRMPFLPPKQQLVSNQCKRVPGKARFRNYISLLCVEWDRTISHTLSFLWPKTFSEEHCKTGTDQELAARPLPNLKTATKCWQCHKFVQHNLLKIISDRKFAMFYFLENICFDFLYYIPNSSAATPSLPRKWS